MLFRWETVKDKCPVLEVCPYLLTLGSLVLAASTRLSLGIVFGQHDFTVASFLPSVLGEGTFLHFLRSVETHSPNPATAEICRRAPRTTCCRSRTSRLHERRHRGESSGPGSVDHLGGGWAQRLAARRRHGCREVVADDNAPTSTPTTSDCRFFRRPSSRNFPSPYFEFCVVRRLGLRRYRRCYCVVLERLSQRPH